MAESEIKLVRQISGSVEAVRALMGVATDDYEDLNNKPSINGVVLRGNLNIAPDGISGLCFYTLNEEVGDVEEICVTDYGVETFRREIQIGDVILSKDKKLFLVNKMKISTSSEGTGSGPTMWATLFVDFSA